MPSSWGDPDFLCEIQVQQTYVDGALLYAV